MEIEREIGFQVWFFKKKKLIPILNLFTSQTQFQFSLLLTRSGTWVSAQHWFLPWYQVVYRWGLGFRVSHKAHKKGHVQKPVTELCTVSGSFSLLILLTNFLIGTCVRQIWHAKG
jgi:hypothetical protein